MVKRHLASPVEMPYPDTPISSNYDFGGLAGCRARTILIPDANLKF